MISSLDDYPGMSPKEIKFQSRNRGSFDFKAIAIWEPRVIITGFNLVIEVLLISSGTETIDQQCQKLGFQSRNRGSFDFKS